MTVRSQQPEAQQAFLDGLSQEDRRYFDSRAWLRTVFVLVALAIPGIVYLWLKDFLFILRYKP